MAEVGCFRQTEGTKKAERVAYPYLFYFLSSNHPQQKEHFLILGPIGACQIDSEANHNPNGQK